MPTPPHTSSRHTRHEPDRSRQAWAGSLSIPVAQRPARYADFSPTELAVVCSNYDLGVIQSIKPVRAGSHTSPKVVIKTRSGAYLLKRRSPGHDDPFRVAASHAVQIHLASRGFPAPRIIGTRRENNSMLQLRGRIYEMFEFVTGRRPDGSSADADACGRTLADFHRHTNVLDTRWEPPEGAYHNAVGIEEHAQAAIRATPSDAHESIDRLTRLFQEARSQTDRLGLARARPVLIHADWHPGNILLEDHRVRAVTDFDSVRLAPRVVDLANGLLQFSIDAGAHSPADWPAPPDLDRYRAFLGGYHRPGDEPVDRAESALIPPLMIQALVAETLLPIARTGRFGPLGPVAFLQAIAVKALWLSENAEALTSGR
ncbi:MAG: phosphotransferase [Planctomycetes bacterium]|nr:phosphotransferase [Planctomycetota bacterium]